MATIRALNNADTWSLSGGFRSYFICCFSSSSGSPEPPSSRTRLIQKKDSEADDASASKADTDNVGRKSLDQLSTFQDGVSFHQLSVSDDIDNVSLSQSKDVPVDNRSKASCESLRTRNTTDSPRPASARGVDGSVDDLPSESLADTATTSRTPSVCTVLRDDTRCPSDGSRKGSQTQDGVKSTNKDDNGSLELHNQIDHVDHLDTSDLLPASERAPNNQHFSEQSVAQAAEHLDQEETLFDVSDLQERELISKCGRLRTTFDYNSSKRRLGVTVHEAQDMPSRDRGGASSTQVRLVVLPTKNVRHRTKVKPGDNPQYEETFQIKVEPGDLSQLGLRLRLYGCERLRRERLIGECVMSFASFQSIDRPCTQWMVLEPRSNLSRVDSRSDITSSTSRSRSGSATSSSDQSTQEEGLPELLLGLTYNGTTGRLTVEVVKGSNFQNLTINRAPDTYVKLVLMSPDGREISRSKTSLRRKQPSPTFRESIVFQVLQSQLPDVSLMVSVFSKRGLKREEMIGWCTLGYSNSGEEERTHWQDMASGKGERIERWHLLLEP